MRKSTDFKTVYDKYGEMLYKIAFVYLGNPDDTEDVLQDVFVSFLQNSAKLKNDEHEKAWLIRTTRNKCLNMLKSPARKSVDLDSIQITSTDTDGDLQIDIIKQVIALPPKYKSAVILYYYNNYSVEEIARILKIGKSAVKMRLKRGRELLKLELEDYNNE